MKVLKATILFAIILITAATIQSFSTVSEQDDPWEVPEKFLTMDNPISGQLDLGKDMYTQHCKSCHGKEGLGDGPKADQLDTPSGDFTDEEFQAQPDGSLFYKSWVGRDDMPAYDKKMSQTETWAVVNYIRTLE